MAAGDNTNPSYDVSYHWTRGEKTGWSTIGHAFTQDNGRIQIYLNANPIPGLQTHPGTMMLFPKTPKEKAQKTAPAAEDG